MAACMLLVEVKRIEKGLGLAIPGFVPSPLGDIVEYMPGWVELAITVGIRIPGRFVLMLLPRVPVPLEVGRLRSHHLEESWSLPKGQGPRNGPRAGTGSGHFIVLRRNFHAS